MQTWFLMCLLLCAQRYSWFATFQIAMESEFTPFSVTSRQWVYYTRIFWAVIHSAGYYFGGNCSSVYKCLAGCTINTVRIILLEGIILAEERRKWRDAQFALARRKPVCEYGGRELTTNFTERRQICWLLRGLSQAGSIRCISEKVLVS